MDYRHKPLMNVGKRSIIEWIIECASLQTYRLVINVNRDVELYEKFGLPLIPDLVSTDAGPLAGIHAAMDWRRENESGSTHIACFPGDVPWFGSDLVPRLKDGVAVTDSLIGWLQTGSQWQPLFSLWDLRLEQRLSDALQLGLYSPMQFIRSQANVLVPESSVRQGDYLNINTLEDLELASSIAALRDSA